MWWHHLHYESPLVAESSRHDGVNSLNDPVQCGVRPNCHVCPTEVIVNRANLGRKQLIRDEKAQKRTMPTMLR